MSRTDKDAPYDVKLRQEGVISHNHISDSCVVGTRSEYFLANQTLRKHRNAGRCTRLVLSRTCVHNAERDRFQELVNQARHSQKRSNPYQCMGDDNEAYVLGITPSRIRSSIAITNMLIAGYIPNCTQAKTHVIDDITELDLRLLPGERIGLCTQRAYTLNYYGKTILSPLYDEDLPCEVCDNLRVPTCFYKRPRNQQRRQKCRCCSEDTREKTPTRVRDELKQIAKEYNSGWMI